MLYTGLDIHKRYSVACTLDQHGRKVKQGRINHGPEAFADYFRSLPEQTEVLLEACWNWGVVFDSLEGLKEVATVMVSNPAKNRIIADAQIKTDKVDAHALGTLLRGRFFAPIHVPGKDVRERKNVIRQRLWMARQRTMIRNRIHALLDRHPSAPRPQFKNLFCKQGIGWMRRVCLPEADRMLLDEQLAMLELIDAIVGQLELTIESYNRSNPVAQRLSSIPGIGIILACVMALEIDTIERFRQPAKLCAYCGLVPTTYSSGGKTHHGRMLPFCNRWLKWAFIEAAWVAVGCSDYFGNYYHIQRARGKQANTAITIVARRMATIAWHLLKEERNYEAFPESVQKISPAALSMD